MDKRRVRVFRDKLLGRRESLVGQVQEAELYSRERDSEATQDPADMASETFERAKDLSILIGMAAKIADIERALERLAAGTYGVCEACGQPIGEDLLEAWPAARFCRTDQARSERRIASVSRMA